jgi:AcrR family transcriptional regulator
MKKSPIQSKIAGRWASGVFASNNHSAQDRPLTSKAKQKTTLAAPKKSLDEYPKGAKKLIITAERLFGQHGIDNVSLRQIVTAAGQANNYAVQHHFGSKEGLIEVIFTLRMSVLDATRAEFLNAIKASGDYSTENLIIAILLPILEAYDEKERHIYADFMLQLFHRNKLQADNFINDGMLSYASFAPAVEEINQLLRKELKHLPSGVFATRYRLAAEVFLSGLTERRRLSYSKGKSYPNPKVFWQDMLHVAVGIFTAPYPPKAVTLTKLSA